jgi:hypothetical protein
VGGRFDLIDGILSIPRFDMIDGIALGTIVYAFIARIGQQSLTIIF